MFEQVLQIIAPHHCYECGITGTLLCDNCKYNITYELFSGCIVCARPAARDGICLACAPSYSRAWVVSEREGTIGDVINTFKFERKKTAANVLVDLFDATVPVLSDTVVVCSVPTVSKHIRERGYDHAALLARGFARKRGLQYQSALQRKNSTTQLGSSKKQRIENAKQAFGAVRVRKGGTYVLVDDVFTTGATMEYAARALLGAGAKDVWIAVVARQPLDKQAIRLI